MSRPSISSALRRSISLLAIGILSAVWTFATPPGVSAGTWRVKRWCAGVISEQNIPLCFLGNYSATAPFDCPKSAHFVVTFSKLIALASGGAAVSFYCAPNPVVPGSPPPSMTVRGCAGDTEKTRISLAGVVVMPSF
jgi:hypothetical protein